MKFLLLLTINTLISTLITSSVIHAYDHQPPALRGVVYASSPHSSIKPTYSSEDDESERSFDKDITTIYFVRHAEQDTTTVMTGKATKSYQVEFIGSPGDPDDIPKITAKYPVGIIEGESLDEVCGSLTCAQGLSLQGKTRSQLLAQWMAKNGIVDKLTHVFSSHKRRTALTVSPTAMMAGIEIEQFPTDGQELNPESNGASVCPTVHALNALPLGSTAVVAVHTSTIYHIMNIGMEGECEGIGLDISNDDDIFPKDIKPWDDFLPREEYSNVWEVSIDANGKATLARRYILDLAFTESVIEESNNSN